MVGLLFIVPTLLLAYAALKRYTRLGALQRGVALAVLAVFTEVVAGSLWWPGSQTFIRELVWSLLIAYLLGLFGHIRESRRAGTGSGLNGWGLAMVTLMFALVLLMNLGLVHVAEQGVPEGMRRHLMPEQSQELAFPGLIASAAQPQEEVLRIYLRGLRRVGQLGWQLSEGWRSGPTAAAASELAIAIRRQDGSPLTGATVMVEALSPIDRILDRWQELDEVEAGVYQVVIEFDKSGVWGLLLRIDYAGETVHLFSTVQVSSFPIKTAGEQPLTQLGTAGNKD